jgi:hypothetical protein
VSAGLTAAGARVCPECGELDSDPLFWQPRCEAAWASVQAPEGVVVVAAMRPVTCPFCSGLVPAPFSVRGRTSRVVSCADHIPAAMRMVAR